MIKTKRLVVAAIAGAFGLGVFATSSFASGPVMLSPISSPTPGLFVAPTVHSVPINKQILKTYRQVRAFWLSRAIVR
ncbi:MAG: hypothetical protein U0103_08955 [Candidatus Obscuribacterales bacterium]|jgi:hypothetical protein|nr:hypothetical protein [Cyanobacteria bacterium SZAS LIN-5]RTL45359.1 MAG: hypothetical protein EKK48_02675 [Candidatus Melainabacteria bacterium]